MLNDFHIRKAVVTSFAAVSLAAMAVTPVESRFAEKPGVETAGIKVARVGESSRDLVYPTQNPGTFSTSLKDYSRRPASKWVSPVAAPEGRLNQAPPNLIASVVGSKLTSTKGIYSVPTSPAMSFQLIKNYIGSNYSCVEANGKFYTVSYANYGEGMEYVTVYVYNSETWTMIDAKDATVADLAFDTAYDPTTGRIYGCFWNEDMTKPVFGYTDYSANPIKTTAIATLEEALYGVAVDRDGSVFGITGNGDLYSMDLTTGKMDLIGASGLASKYMTCATIDLRTGRLFYAVSNDGFGALYEIDKTTAKATLMTEFENYEELNGLYAAKPIAEDGAPDIAGDLHAVFDRASLSGEIVFQAPDKYFCGDPTEGNISYVVTANGAEAAKGETKFGALTKVPVTVEAPGQYKFEVTLSNEAGEGPKASTSLFVGPDVPKATTVKSEYADGKFNVSWTPVSESVNGGFVDVENITYTVTRYPDETVVKKNIKETSIVDVVPEFEGIRSIYYTVAVSDGISTSAVAKSNAVVLGSVTPPYAETFETSESISYFTVIDANGDGKTWQWDYNGAAKLPYSGMYDSDDWLLTPMMNLEAGKAYILRFRVYGGDSTVPEKFEVKYGKTPTAEGLDKVLVEVTEIRANKSKYIDYERIITPAETGQYYIGFHGVSEADKYNLYIDNVNVLAGVDKNVPAAVTDIKTEAADDKNLSTTVSFKAPATTLGGDKLDNGFDVVLCRDGVVINTFKNVSAGADLSFTDTEVYVGWHVWSAFAVNKYGEGPLLGVKSLVGQDYANPVTELKAVEGTTYGEVTISWKASTATLKGDPLSADDVTYNLYSRGDYEHPVATGLRTTSYSYAPVASDANQKFMQWEVSTVTDAGENFGGTPSVAVPLGKPHDCPYLESFPEKNASHPLAIMSENQNSRWGVYDGTSFSNQAGNPIVPYDNDNGMAVIYGLNKGYYADMFTAKIAVPEKNPEISFYLYPLGVDDNNRIEVYAIDRDTEYEIGSIVLNAAGTVNRWNRVAMSLDKVAGKAVYLKFRGFADTYTRSFMDRVLVDVRPDNDLAITGIKAPVSVMPSEEFNVAVTVANYGSITAENYTVELMCNGAVVKTLKGEALATSEVKVVNIPCTLSSVAAENNIYSATVNIEGDSNTDNNKSERVSVELIQHPYPGVSGLKGEIKAEGVALGWLEPDMSDLHYKGYTENFESATAWSRTFGGWTFVDLDGGIIGAFDLNSIPTFTPFESKSEFFVFEGGTSKFNSTFDAHSGNNYLAVIYNYFGVQNDDWVISPKLFGGEQTVSFFASSYNPSYPETFEVLYATEDFDAENFDADKFTSLKVFRNAPSGWNEYKIDLPEGAKYFAIRCTSNDAMMLMIDDVTYIAEAGVDNLALMGYNVYRDGEKLNEAPIEEPEFLDTTPTSENHVYSVTSVYDLGESMPVSITVSKSALDKLESDGIDISAYDSAIVINGACGSQVSVVTVDGKVIYTGIATENTVVPVSNGFYIVKAGTAVKKLQVK